MGRRGAFRSNVNVFNGSAHTPTVASSPPFAATGPAPSESSLAHPPQITLPDPTEALDNRPTARRAGAPTRLHTFDTFQATPYFPALDGLRAWAILLVLFHHVPLFAPGFWHDVQQNGRYGVSFFFAVSGFLICTLLLREKDRTGRVQWRKFYARRALRLLPLYYVTLAAQCVLVFWLHQYSPENQELFRTKLPAYMLYFSNWLATATQGPFFYAWSLAVEEQFYLGFGLLLWLMPRRQIVTLLAFALATKFAVYQLFGSIDEQSTLWRILFSYQEAILWGVLLAFALNTRHGFSWLTRLLRLRATLPLLAVAVAAWLCRAPLETQSTWDAEVLYVLMTLTIAAAVVRRRTPVLAYPPLAFVGKISYGIYLLHTFVIYAVKKIPAFSDPVTCFVVSVPLSIAIAAVVYRCFERPIIDYYKRRLSPLEKIARESAPPLPNGTPASATL